MKAQQHPGEEFDASFDADDADPSTVARREEKVRRDFWTKFRKVASRIPFAEDLVAAYYCALDTNTPLKVRGTLLGALAYFILPIDLVPDFIAGLGFGDDAAILAAAVSMVSGHILPVHREAAAKALGKEQPGDDEAEIA